MADPKCDACRRVAATHAAGCSLVECPHRRAQVWDGPEGLQGFPGSLAEDRIVARMSEKHRAVSVDLADL